MQVCLCVPGGFKVKIHSVTQPEGEETEGYMYVKMTILLVKSKELYKRKKKKHGH